DLNPHFLDFINLPEIKDVRAALVGGKSKEEALAAGDLKDYPHAAADYTGYLQRLADVHYSMPARIKSTRQYRKYLLGVAAYLASFINRTHPLVDSRELWADLVGEFLEAWNAGSLPGWTATGAEHAEEPAESPTDLNAFENLAAIKTTLGVDGIKAQLKLRG